MGLASAVLRIILSWICYRERRSLTGGRIGDQTLCGGIGCCSSGSRESPGPHGAGDMSDFVWPSVRVAGDLERARVEWIHGNGAGAFASSTVAQMHTRRYHGLLVASLDPPRRRHVVLSHIDATLHTPEKNSELWTHQFPSVPPTGGHRYLTHFAQDPLPRWTFDVSGGQLEQTLGLVRGENAVVLRYVWKGSMPVAAEFRPLLAMRPFHELVHEHGAMIQRVELRQHEVTVRPVPTMPKVSFRHHGIFVGSPDWWRRFEYLAEQTRGLAFQEDLWTPGVFRLTMQPDTPTYFTCSVGKLPDRLEPELLEEAAESIRRCDPGPQRPWAVRSLSVAADLFRADLASAPGIIAGYPWFEVWGRHSLIALPGLYLLTGRLEAAKRVVETLVLHMRDGLIPNRLPDDGRPAEYHSVDASLLLFRVARRMANQLGSSDPFVSNVLMPAMLTVFEAFEKGTVDRIHVTSDGLLAAGGPGTSLTWMDARVDNVPVTSRAGLAVEIQALWSAACDTLAHLAAELGQAEVAHRASDACDRARAAFRKRFWCDGTGYPYDAISEATDGPDAWADARIRPNALIALSVDAECFTQEQAQATIARAERELMTSAGVRTLAPHEANYRGRYAGGILDRDRAYHQGTVWPFLMGALARAVRQTYPSDGARLASIRAVVEAMMANHLALGQLPELADGDAPNRPDGCIAFAASVGELLCVFVEELGM